MFLIKINPFMIDVLDARAIRQRTKFSIQLSKDRTHKKVNKIWHIGTVLRNIAVCIGSVI